MCTNIAHTTGVVGAGKGAAGWFAVTHACVGYDHSTHTADEHALLLDFMNPTLGPSARVAVELDLDSGRALLAQLQAAIDAAERASV